MLTRWRWPGSLQRMVRPLIDRLHVVLSDWLLRVQRHELDCEIGYILQSKLDQIRFQRSVRNARKQRREMRRRQTGRAKQQTSKPCRATADVAQDAPLHDT